MVWISATNNLTAVVKIYELPQYVLKNISRVWGMKSILVQIYSDLWTPATFVHRNLRKNVTIMHGVCKSIWILTKNDITSKFLDNIYSSYSWVYLPKIGCKFGGF